MARGMLGGLVLFALACSGVAATALAKPPPDSAFSAAKLLASEQLSALVFAPLENSIWPKLNAFAVDELRRRLRAEGLLSRLPARDGFTQNDVEAVLMDWLEQGVVAATRDMRGAFAERIETALTPKQRFQAVEFFRSGVGQRVWRRLWAGVSTAVDRDADAIHDVLDPDLIASVTATLPTEDLAAWQAFRSSPTGQLVWGSVLLTFDDLPDLATQWLMHDMMAPGSPLLERVCAVAIAPRCPI